LFYFKYGRNFNKELGNCPQEDEREFKGEANS
jgi:hypothetical protein